jgi:DsbC/DsbD-like thiol-disulfide interchange protein
VKKRTAKLIGVVLGTLLFAFAPLASSQSVSGRDVLTPTAYASFDPVARGMNLDVAVVLKIKSGFHVNARKVTAEYLIPTDLRLDVPAGFKLADVVYPDGTLQTFAFSKNKQLNVYTDTVTIRLPLMVMANAPLGAQHVPMKLRYQACSTEICLPPVTKDVDLTLNVVANHSGVKAVNAEIFSKK